MPLATISPPIDPRGLAVERPIPPVAHLLRFVLALEPHIFTLS